MTYGALIVGLGQIGMGFDLALSPDKYILTHARAYQQHPEFQLLAGVDPDPVRRQLFENHYGSPAYPDIHTAVTEHRPDVVSLATPTQKHYEGMRSIMQAGSPAAILCEKPLAYVIEDAREMQKVCTARNCRLYVNYMRRSDSGVMEIKRRMQCGQIALPVKGVAWYSKGLFNNGSHFFNLLQYWLGEVQNFKIIESGRLWDGIDPEPDLRVTFAGGTIQFLAAQEENFSHYTVELIAQNGRLRYEQGGVRIAWQATVKDNACEGYIVLDPIEEIIPTSLDRIQWHVVDQLAKSLHGQDAYICSGEDALQTLESLTAIKGKL